VSRYPQQPPRVRPAVFLAVLGLLLFVGGGLIALVFALTAGPAYQPREGRNAQRGEKDGERTVSGEAFVLGRNPDEVDDLLQSREPAGAEEGRKRPSPGEGVLVVRTSSGELCNCYFFGTPALERVREGDVVTVRGQVATADNGGGRSAVIGRDLVRCRLVSHKRR
jgi:hypothetical protein